MNVTPVAKFPHLSCELKRHLLKQKILDQYGLSVGYSAQQANGLMMADTALPEQWTRTDRCATDGTRAAELIWNDHSDADLITDPRSPAFAGAVIDALAHALAAAPGVLHRVMSGAASAAEDLNVEPFQGLVEVIQNADDLGAAEVRFALRERQGNRELLILDPANRAAVRPIHGIRLIGLAEAPAVVVRLDDEAESEAVDDTGAGD